jgi:hypothetical protein
MDKSQFYINELKNIFVLIQRESGQSVPALAEPSFADSAVTTSMPRELVDKFKECIKAYEKKFNRNDISASQMYRILYFHFLDNWENMPMEKAWKLEKERSFVMTRPNKMRLTVSGI